MPLATGFDCDVLVVGGSLVGLSAACFLAAQGVDVQVVEKHGGTSIHPRAGHFHLGTMEAFRRIGLEPGILAASRSQFGPDGGINLVESLAGRELAQFISDINAGVEPYSPSRRFFMTQQSLEPLLLERARELGARLAYRHEVTGFTQDGDGVAVTARDLDGGEERGFRARYMIAADGNRSAVRKALGIATAGPGWLSNSITIYFSADCRQWLEGRKMGVIYVKNADQRGFFRFEAGGTRGFLAVNTLGDLALPGAREVASDTSSERAAALVRSAVGVPDLEVEIEDVATWRAEAICADRWRAGRVFLAGDAAHVVPPTGGFGGNTGVQDADNLAWKLAMVISGQASDTLLDSYEAERLPVARMVVEQAFARYVRRVTPEEITADTPGLIDDLAIELGQLYGSNAVIGGRQPGEPTCMHPDLTGARAGTRVPHAWLAKGRSTIDLPGGRLTRLAGSELSAEAAAKLHLAPAEALLVRPDGFVAWRGPADDAPAARARIIAP